MTKLKIPGAWIQYRNDFDCNSFIASCGFTVTRRERSRAYWDITLNENLTTAQKHKLRRDIKAELCTVAILDDWDALRLERNRRLKSSDWTQMVDAPLTQTKIDEWKDYRQMLRDLPGNTADPNNPNWPVEPS